MRLSLSAIGLFCLGLSYAADNQTDGELPREWVEMRTFGQDEKPVQELLGIGLWSAKDGGYFIHDFLEYNPSSEEQEEAKKGARERKEKSRDIRRDIYVKDGVQPGMGMGKGVAKKFSSWLLHFHETTGRTQVRGSKPARDAFAARLKEGLSEDELKLATVGCHSDEYLREHGWDVPETILRREKITRYIELGRKAISAGEAPTSEYDEGTVEAQV